MSWSNSYPLQKDEEDAFAREEIFKVKVFEMRHEAFRTLFEERYFFYLLPNKNNNGPRKNVKNLKGDISVGFKTTCPNTFSGRMF